MWVFIGLNIRWAKHPGIPNIFWVSKLRGPWYFTKRHHKEGNVEKCPHQSWGKISGLDVLAALLFWCLCVSLAQNVEIISSWSLGQFEARLQRDKILWYWPSLAFCIIHIKLNNSFDSNQKLEIDNHRVPFMVEFDGSTKSAAATILPYQLGKIFTEFHQEVVSGWLPSFRSRRGSSLLSSNLPKNLVKTLILDQDMIG